MSDALHIVICGLSVTSSWGNGHATTYRGLMRGLHERGHRVTFLERDVPWYAGHRDLPELRCGNVQLYSSVAELKKKFRAAVVNADVVIVGSYVPDGHEIGKWVTAKAKGVTAFYDIDTPVTLASLDRGITDYISPDLIPRYDLYLSFTGGPTLQRIERVYHAKRARPLYCAVDPSLHLPQECEPQWDLGYMGTYSSDRQPPLERLMLEPARQMKDARMVVAGPMYPDTIAWPAGVERIEHLPPGEHRKFYCSQRFTLNLTRAEMLRTGYSPSVRLFEAAACATPIITDEWKGLETFFRPGREILVTRSAKETLECLRDLTDNERKTIGRNARERVLREHTAIHRAIELESLVAEVQNTQHDKAVTFETVKTPLKAAGQTGD